MVLCRWQDVLLLLLPAGLELDALRRRELRFSTPGYWRSRLTAMAVAAVLFVPQAVQWHQIYGVWLTLPQGGAFFHFPPAHVIDVLFSSRNGWFVWTPITFLAVLGMGLLARSRPVLGISLFASVAAEVALVGSVVTWHSNWFGQRYLTSLVPLVGVGLMALAQRAAAADSGRVPYFAEVLACWTSTTFTR
jgi:hypothetical protein